MSVRTRMRSCWPRLPSNSSCDICTGKAVQEILIMPETEGTRVQGQLMRTGCA